MGNIFNQDFRDFLFALNEANVEYILVGGYAVILHGYNRTTGDLDVWVNPCEKNFDRLRIAFKIFGLPIDAISKNDFLNNDDFDVFSFGKPPVSIDIMTAVKGLEFEPTYQKSSTYETEGLQIQLIHYSSLLTAKRSSGRYKDLNDIEHLEEQ